MKARTKRQLLQKLAHAETHLEGIKKRYRGDTFGSIWLKIYYEKRIGKIQKELKKLEKNDRQTLQ